MKLDRVKILNGLHTASHALAVAAHVSALAGRIPTPAAATFSGAAAGLGVAKVVLDRQAKRLEAVDVPSQILPS